MINGFDYTQGVSVVLTRAQWQERMTEALNHCGRRRVEHGDTALAELGYRNVVDSGTRAGDRAHRIGNRRAVHVRLRPRAHAPQMAQGSKYRVSGETVFQRPAGSSVSGRTRGIAKLPIAVVCGHDGARAKPLFDAVFVFAGDG